MPRSPGAAFWSTGTLVAHRLPSRQQRRGNVAKKDEAVPAGRSRPVDADGLNWSPDASVHGGTVMGNPVSVKPLVQLGCGQDSVTPHPPLHPAPVAPTQGGRPYSLLLRKFRKFRKFGRVWLGLGMWRPWS